jgi:hypothetical protein
MGSRYCDAEPRTAADKMLALPASLPLTAGVRRTLGEVERRRASTAGVVNDRAIDRMRDVPCRPLRVPKAPRRR